MVEHTFALQAALACCQEHGIVAAEAYLLERQGDILAALAIYISEIKRANTSLAMAVKSGKVTLPRTAPRQAALDTGMVLTYLNEDLNEKDGMMSCMKFSRCILRFVGEPVKSFSQESQKGDVNLGPARTVQQA